jgi:hypothetical protein
VAGSPRSSATKVRLDDDRLLMAPLRRIAMSLGGATRHHPLRTTNRAHGGPNYRAQKVLTHPLGLATLAPMHHAHAVPRCDHRGGVPR